MSLKTEPNGESEMDYFEEIEIEDLESAEEMYDLLAQDKFYEAQEKSGFTIKYI